MNEALVVPIARHVVPITRHALIHGVADYDSGHHAMLPIQLAVKSDDSVLPLESLPEVEAKLARDAIHTLLETPIVETHSMPK